MELPSYPYAATPHARQDFGDLGGLGNPRPGNQVCLAYALRDSGLTVC
jgi:hypothetical protein